MLNSKVVDYINFILRAGEFKNCPAEKVSMHVCEYSQCILNNAGDKCYCYVILLQFTLEY